MPWYARIVTSKVSLPQVADAVEQVRAQLENARHVALIGDPASGRSTVLAKLASELDGPLISTPRTGDDAAAVILIELASQLPDAVGITEQLKRLDLRWEKKLDLVGASLAKTEKVVFFDEPVLVPRSGAPQDAFERRRIELGEMVLQRASKVVFTAEPSIAFFHPHHVAIATRSDAADVLASAHWGDWASSAAELARKGGSKLDAWSPLALRMAVALIAHGAKSAQLVERPLGARLLAQQLVGVLRDDPALQKLAETLALVRLPFTPDLLAHLGASKLADPATQLLRGVLTYEVDGRLVFHDVLARTLVRVNPESTPHERAQERAAREGAHQHLATYYQEKFEAAAGSADLARSLRFEMETVHHLTEACDATALTRFKPYFVEQWDALGKALGQARKHEDAVRCYERALEHDPEDSYAHHYKAFNLDWRAERVDEVEEHYREAIRIEPRHVWHHGRFTCFLVTRGRLTDARDAWTAAVSELAPGGDYRFATTYEELHKQVARLLLHRGELEFAHDVLTDVTDPTARASEWYRALVRHEQVLEEAARDEVVFPPHVELADRWKGPHTVPGGSRPASLVAWMPGRVARVDGSEVHIRIAQLEDGVPRFGWRSFDAAAFRALLNWQWDVPAGTFVEIMSIVDEPSGVAREMIRAHERARLEPPLPGIVPPPDRYLRRVAPLA
jgi:tetratricopeptide (TPR) repeat protein